MNKSLKWMLGAAAVAAACASGAAQAAHVGVFIGGPVIAAPYYYPVGPVVAPAYYGYPVYPAAEPDDEDDQPVYIERSQAGGPAAPQADTAPPGAAQQGTWYYCPSSKTYYPYVKTCTTGWQAVPAKPQ